MRLCKSQGRRGQAVRQICPRTEGPSAMIFAEASKQASKQASKPEKSLRNKFLASMPRRPYPIVSIQDPYPFLSSKKGIGSFSFYPVRSNISNLRPGNWFVETSIRVFNPNNRFGHTPCKDGRHNTQNSSAGSSLPIFSACPWKIIDQLLRKPRGKSRTRISEIGIVLRSAFRNPSSGICTVSFEGKFERGTQNAECGRGECGSRKDRTNRK